MGNAFNQSLNLTSDFFTDIGNSEGILSMIQIINNDMHQVPALMILLVVGFVIAISLIKGGRNVMNSITVSSYVITVSAVLMRIMSLIGDKVLIGTFFITGICIYVQVAHKSDFS